MKEAETEKITFINCEGNSCARYKMNLMRDIVVICIHQLCTSLKGSGELAKCDLTKPVVSVLVKLTSL